MAKMYLGTNDTNYNIVNNNTTIFGATGTQSIVIAAGLTGVVDATLSTLNMTVA